MALLHASGFSLSTERLPEGEAKLRILSAIDRVRSFIPFRVALRFLQLRPSRFQTWRADGRPRARSTIICPVLARHRMD
jgi:hypothetical protein